MTRVHYVLTASTPPGQGWLTEEERRVLATLEFPRRRADWRLGRWTAKQAVMACLADDDPGLRPDRVGILAGADGAPRTTAAGIPPVTVSISHRDGLAFCVAARDELPLGCDVERIEPRSHAFVQDYFTAHETAQVLAAPDRALAANLVWAAKEAALKALRQGLRVDTRSLEVEVSTLRPGNRGPAQQRTQTRGMRPGAYANGDRTTDTGPGTWHSITIVRNGAAKNGSDDEGRRAGNDRLRLEGLWQRRGNVLLVAAAARPFTLVEHEAAA